MRLAGVMFLAALASTEAAVTFTIQPAGSTPNSGDAYLYSANANANFGNAGALSVAGSSAPNGALASVLKFDLSAAKAAFDLAFGVNAWTLASAAIQLTAVTPNNANFSPLNAGIVSVDWLVDDSWTETGITWNGLSALLGGGTESMGNFSFNGSLGTTEYGLTMASGFLIDLQAGGISSFHLGAGDSDVSLVTNSRNFGTPMNRPALILTAVPEPGRLMTLLAGCALMTFRRQRLMNAARSKFLPLTPGA